MTTVSADSTCCFADSRKSVCSGREEQSVSFLDDSDVDRIVERKFRANNFRVLQWSLDSLGETNGFLGSYHSLSVTVSIGNESRHSKFFVKTPPPPNSPQYDFLVRTDTFNKEIIVYSELVPRMGMGVGFKWVPDYYLGKSNTVIVLEDAKQGGYVTPDKYVPFDEEHCILVAKTLSTFHSRSLILDEKLRRSSGQTVFDLYGHLLKELAFIENDTPARNYLYSCIKGAHAIVDLHEGLKEDEVTAIKEWIATWVPRLPKTMDLGNKYRNVTCHRDLWANNIMIKRDSTGKPIACYLVDFQFLRWSPPAIDFVICFLLTTDRATRRRCYDRLIDVYYETMEKELAAEGLTLEDCLSRKEFLQCCNEIRGTALAYTVANMQIMLLTKDAVEKYFTGNTDELEYVMYGDRRPELVRSQCRAVKAYQTRMLEIIEEIRDHLANNPSEQ